MKNKKNAINDGFTADIEENIELGVRNLLSKLGEDTNRPGLIDTPKRVAKSLSFLTKGYKEDLNMLINGALFEHKSSEMVIVKNIEFYSMCEHHILPFFGKAHVGYMPNGKILGLSKVARIVDVFSRRLQVQERLSSQIADTLMKILNPLGVGVVLEASHFCMMMRGIEKQNSCTTTSSFRGIFCENQFVKHEFISLLGNTR